MSDLLPPPPDDATPRLPDVAPLAPISAPSPAERGWVDFGGHKGVPLSPARWSVWMLFGLVVLAVAFAFGSSWFAYRSGIMHGLTADMRAVVLTAIIFVQYLPPLALVALLARRRGVRVRDAFSLRRFDVGAGIGMAIGFAFAARLLGIEYAVTMQQLGIKAPNTGDITQLFPLTPIGVLATVLTAVVFAPLAEEALFRGVVFAGLRDRWGRTAGVLVSAGLFALVHFSWYQFVPLFLLGIMLAWLVSTTRSVWPSIACHAMFNASAVALLYLLRAFGVGG